MFNLLREKCSSVSEVKSPFLEFFLQRKLFRGAGNGELGTGCGWLNRKYRERKRAGKKVPLEKTSCPGLHILSIERRGREGALAWAVLCKQCE